jgi:hypothetical protein
MNLGAALYGHGPLYGYGPLVGYGKPNPWREFIKANKGKFHSLTELSKLYQAAKAAAKTGTGYF